jgi:plastocyanin
VTIGASGASADFLFDTAGTYGFYCHDHGHPDGSGMAGSILVQ